MRFLSIFFLLIIASGPAFAASAVTFAPRYIANDGSDTNDCLSATQQAGNVGPCATMQNAVDSMPPGGPYTLQLICNLAAGQECGFAPVNIAHFRFVAINGDCSVAGFGRIKIVAPAGQVGIWIQDHATATAQCVAFEGRAFALRQYAVGDCAFCVFRGATGGPLVALNGNGTSWNCIAPIYLYGGATAFVDVGTGSEAVLNCAIVVSAVAFTDALIKVKDGKVVVSDAIFQNDGPTGRQYMLTNGILEKGSVIVPGSIAGSADGYSIIR